MSQKAQTYLKGEEIFQNPRTRERWTGDLAIRKRMWTRILKRAKVRYRYPYQMRHTYASMMLMAGESPQWIASQVGHTDWTFTARTYSRFIPDDAPDAGEKAVQRWGNAGKKLSLRTSNDDKKVPASRSIYSLSIS
jgi:integrase